MCQTFETDHYIGITSVDEVTGPDPSPIVPDFYTDALGDFRIVEKAT